MSPSTHMNTRCVHPGGERELCSDSNDLVLLVLANAAWATVKHTPDRSRVEHQRETVR